MPKRLPDHIKAARGTLRKDRTQGAARVTFDNKLTTAPRGASAEVRRFYREHAPALARKGLLTEADAATFRLMAESYGIACEAMKTLQTEGVFRQDTNGAWRRHIAVAVHRDATQTFLRLADRFGLNPKSRDSLRDVTQPDPDSLTQAFFKKAVSDAQ
jgi:P27 family predicted phage terminase small subunit